jgi:integrase
LALPVQGFVQQQIAGYMQDYMQYPAKGVFMRVKNVFSVFARKMPSGKVVFYYQTYDGDGRRICAHSTGERTKTAAQAYCMLLFREGKLLPDRQQKKALTFAEFAQGWWEWETCPYLRRRMARRPITRSYADRAKRNMTKHLLPYFGKMRLDRISETDVENWLLSFGEENGNKKKIKNSTANLFFDVLKTMLNEAVRRRLIAANPANRVEELRDDQQEIKILTPEETKKLFPPQWETVWTNYAAFSVNRLAACTGMRIGELMGLKTGYVFEDHIHVCAQYTEAGEYTETKTHDMRDIPITPVIRGWLEKLMARNAGGYLFSENGGKTPLERGEVYRDFYAALERTGICGAQRKARRISLHGWRHFFNTTLRVADVEQSKVNLVAGHKSQRMNDRYTHFDPKKFAEVRRVQETIFQPEEKETPHAIQQTAG